LPPLAAHLAVYEKAFSIFLFFAKYAKGGVPDYILPVFKSQNSKVKSEKRASNTGEAFEFNAVRHARP
jgi:hypothetical protein